MIDLLNKSSIKMKSSNCHELKRTVILKSYTVVYRYLRDNWPSEIILIICRLCGTRSWSRHIEPYSGLPFKYLEKPVFAYHPIRFLISESEALLTAPQTRGEMYGNGWFVKAATTWWNNPPVNIDIFKKVKINLFIYFSLSYLLLIFF